MGKTLDVARDRTFDQTKTVPPAEVARGTYMQNAPSLQALKLMHLMIGTAGGRMADEIQHQIRLSGIRKIDGMKNHDRANLTPLFRELAAVVLTYDDPEKMVVTIGGLLDEAKIDYQREVSGDLVVSSHLPQHGSGIEPLGHPRPPDCVSSRQQVFRADVPTHRQPCEPRPGAIQDIHRSRAAMGSRRANWIASRTLRPAQFSLPLPRDSGLGAPEKGGPSTHATSIRRCRISVQKWAKYGSRPAPRAVPALLYGRRKLAQRPACAAGFNGRHGLL